MTILVTGAAGFIGFSVSKRLLEQGIRVHGIDNLNDYYDVTLKHNRLHQLKVNSNFTFDVLDISDREAIQYLFKHQRIDAVIHLAAQAGVRHSLENPFVYVDNNLLGFLTILEGCRYKQVNHLVYASSSSVYGANRKPILSVSDKVEHPLSLYAATKKANELMAYSYSHLYGIPTTGLRFFTVYGPWGRPDMAYFKFVDAIAHNRPIYLYNHGKIKRDFTYIDDIVESVIRVLKHPPQMTLDDSSGDYDSINKPVPYKLYNVGNNQPVELLTLVEAIEAAMGKKAEKIMQPMQSSDLPATYADVTELVNDIGFAPSTPIEQGIQKFVKWYQDYHGTTFRDDRNLVMQCH